MSPELIEQLVQNHPEFFPPDGTPAGRQSRNIDCGDGWYFLIDELFGFLRWQVVITPLERMRQPVVSRIDRDRGHLRIRFRRPTTPVQLLVDFVQCLAMSTCDVCGRRGSLHVNDQGVSVVRCPHHRCSVMCGGASGATIKAGR